MLKYPHIGLNSHERLQVLKDDTTLEDNKISNENFVVVMVTKVSTTVVSQLTYVLISEGLSGHSARHPRLVTVSPILCSLRRPQLVLSRRRSSSQQQQQPRPVQHSAQR